ncbi:copper chaperone PCu(A)C [Methylopila sp. Yamaguchi]|uniref:copper chaperone PCu(A)C n=1 Tax=Methylopila sp. Yamaguchi TaxID=1437817 RepID=UPI000CA9A00A|nr:copper chaperone PCu(A)C [Methylopila sp. Yamaguchi]GBD48400.1 hypothetical protein METY_1613 [Methylopila sp. Yamaguchi]
MIRTIIGAVAALGLMAAAASAHEYKAGALEIAHPWVRATAPGAKVGGGFLVVTNTGKEADRLVSVAASFADKTELHESLTEEGVAKMRPLANGAEAPAGGKLEFAPGGKHIMFVGLKQPFKQGEKLKATLTFEKAGPVDVEFAVEAVGYRPAGEPKGAETHMGH